MMEQVLQEDVECNGDNSEDEELEGEEDIKAWEESLVTLEGRLTTISSDLEKDEELSGNMEKRRLKLTEMRETVSNIDEELKALLDHPQLIAMYDTHSPSPAVTVIHSKAQVLQVRSQGVAHDLETLLADLQNRIEEQRQQIIQDLESVENWMGVAYAMVLLEPNRSLYSGNIVDEASLRARSESSSSMDDEEWRGRGSDVSGGEDEEGAGKSGRGDAEVGVADGEEGPEEDKEYEVSFRMSLSPEPDEVEEEGVNQEGVNGGGEGVNEGTGSDVTTSQTGTVTSGEESSDATQSGDTGESENLDWILELRILPQYHAPTLRKDLGLRRASVDEQELDHLLSNLGKLIQDLPIQSQKVKKAKANVNFVINTLPADSAAEYQERLQLLQARWEVLDRELNLRQQQLLFERVQKITLEGLQEAMSELHNQPNTNLLHEEVKEKHSDLMDFIISLEQFNSLKEEQLSCLTESLNKLEQFGEGEELPNWEEELPQWRELVERFTVAYEHIARKIAEQVAFLEKCLEQWVEFEKLYKRSEMWLGKAEHLVGRDTYGYDLKEVDAYLQEVKSLHLSIPAQEELGAQIVSLGKSMLVAMEEGGVAEEYIDQKLSDVDGRLAELVTPHSGNIDAREIAVNKVITDWRGYTGMLVGTRSFITQMSKMVGPEPKETSNGNATLLNTYITYSNQLKQIEVQYKRLVTSGQALSTDSHVGCRAVFAQELKDLQMQWGPLKDNVMDTLDLLIREYNDWILMKLKHMNKLVTQAQDLVQRELHFIQSFPLLGLLKEDAEELLKEADSLVAGQDQLGQMEGECTLIEETLLERQIQQETFGGFTASQGDLEYPSTVEEKTRLQTVREKVQSDSEYLSPILNILYLQLQLLQNIQDGNKLVEKAMDFMDELAPCQSLLSELDLALSPAHFSRLQGQAYDLGTVMEEVQETVDTQSSVFELPPCEKLTATNKLLTAEIDTLSSASEQAKLRLQLLVQWWEEFNSNYSEVTSWLDESEASLEQLVARYESAQPPRVSPADILQELKELSAGVEEKSVLVCALEATGKNILDEIEVKGGDHTHMPANIASVRSRWEELRKALELQINEVGITAENFDNFITRLTGFVSWLNEFYGRLCDEVCIQLPTKASDEVLSRHKNQLEVYRAEVLTRQGRLEEIRAESEQWAGHLVPDSRLGELPSPTETEPTPPPDDEECEFPPEYHLPYIKKHVTTMLATWATVQRLLQEREQQLELSTGSYQAFMEHAQKLLSWLQGKLEMGALFGAPPADLEVVEGYQNDVQMTKDELTTRKAGLHALERMAATLKGHMTPASTETLDELLEKARDKWVELERGTEARNEVLEPLVDRLRQFKQENSQLEVWLKEREAEFEDCGTIGANLERCEQQAGILEQLDEDLLNGKQATEKIRERADTLFNEFEVGSRTKIQEWVSDYEKRYGTLCEDTAEQRERCEEATAALQSLMEKVRKFEEWVGTMEETLEQRKKEKQPIGTLQTVLDEHYEFMHDIETHTEEYCVLVPEGRGLMEEYTPNHWLAGVMQTLEDKWSGYVDALFERCQELLALLELWEHYEKDVKDLLGWIMTEADSFSKDVTTKGDKGIVDHMETCKVFMDTLEGKHVKIEEITDQASLLKAEDGEKKNGTSDVESRWNDVQMHWNSCCKLLSETLLHLEATEAEMRHVLLIRGEEFEWLEACEYHAHQRERTRGDLDLLQNEIEKHEQLLEQVQEHEEARQFLLSTVPFLVEHSRKKDREDMRIKAEEFDQRHRNLSESLDTYVNMLKESIPFWKRFNTDIKDVTQWLERVNSDLVSENVQFGNAIVTENSLVFCQGLQVDIQDHTHQVREVGSLGEMLAKYVIAEDREYVMELVERISKREELVTKETDEKTELLEERLKSWQVFPVEEARVVQQFLEQVGSVVEMDEEAEEELTSDQLLEQLERLEQLQALQSSNEDKVQTIDQSSHSADVQRALERNPDISKERTNLLQGWTSVSSTLKDRITVMKRKAEMVKDLEQAMWQVEENVRRYKEYLDTPLPPSVLLAGKHRQISDEGISLQDACLSSLSHYHNQLNQSQVSEGDTLSVPQRFRDKVNTLSDQFDELETRGTQRTNQIRQSVTSWEGFIAEVGELMRWVRSEELEMVELRCVEKFAMEFSSHRARLEIVSEDLEAHKPSFASLQDSAPQHTEGEEPEVQEVQKQYTSLVESWNSLSEEISYLLVNTEPWKELTDQFDELSCFVDELEELVERDEGTARGLDETEGGDLSDWIVNFKDYLKRLSQKEESFSTLDVGVAKLLPQEVCEEHEACRELEEACRALHRKWEGLSNRAEGIVESLTEKEAVWKQKAVASMRRVGVLQTELSSYQHRLLEKDREIARLRNRPPPQAPPPEPDEPPPQSCCTSRRLGVAILMGVAVAGLAYLCSWDTGTGLNTM